MDFETVMWYLQEALEKSTDPTVRAQAQGWRIFKARRARAERSRRCMCS